MQSQMAGEDYLSQTTPGSGKIDEHSTYPPQSRWALGMSAAAQRTVFVALMLTLLSLASQQSVLAQDYTWTGRTAPVAQSWEGVTYGNGLFVAIAQWNEGSDVMTSPDGITWTLRTTPPLCFLVSGIEKYIDIETITRKQTTR